MRELYRITYFINDVGAGPTIDCFFASMPEASMAATLLNEKDDVFTIVEGPHRFEEPIPVTFEEFKREII